MIDRCPDCSASLSSTVIGRRVVLACLGCRTWFERHELAALRLAARAGYTPELTMSGPSPPGPVTDTMSRTNSRSAGLIPFTPRERRS